MGSCKVVARVDGNGSVFDNLYSNSAEEDHSAKQLRPNKDFRTPY